MKWGWSPSALIRGAKKPRKHHDCDYALAIAYELIDSEKCGQCGTPAYWAYSENPAIAFKLDPITCYACQYKAREEKDATTDPGTYNVVKAVAEEGFELPGREDFVQRQLKKQQREAAKLAATHTH